MGRHLVNAAKYCSDSGIAVCGPGQPINVIGANIRYTDKVVYIQKLAMFVLCQSYV